MLLVVGWSSVVVWLNVKPHSNIPISRSHGAGLFRADVTYGYPLPYAWEVHLFDGSAPHPPPLPHRCYEPFLAVDVAIGMLAVVVLTWVSSYLMRGIASWTKGGHTEEE